MDCNMKLENSIIKKFSNNDVVKIKKSQLLGIQTRKKFTRSIRRGFLNLRKKVEWSWI